MVIFFPGPRGTWKTSTARILAKMVNKTTDDVQECPLCQKISEGSCVDVIEIDAASHTGVDHMRQLTEQVQFFLPVEAKVKVFIIDEVHMLSSGAFNALLKTLEEPLQIFYLFWQQQNCIKFQQPFSLVHKRCIFACLKKFKFEIIFVTFVIMSPLQLMIRR